jgi:hypothetical protein
VSVYVGGGLSVWGGLSDVSLVEKYRMDDETYGEGGREGVSE